MVSRQLKKELKCVLNKLSQKLEGNMKRGGQLVTLVVKNLNAQKKKKKKLLQSPLLPPPLPRLKISVLLMLNMLTILIAL